MQGVILTMLLILHPSRVCSKTSPETQPPKSGAVDQLTDSMSQQTELGYIEDQPLPKRRDAGELTKKQKKKSSNDGTFISEKIESQKKQKVRLSTKTSSKLWRNSRKEKQQIEQQIQDHKDQQISQLKSNARKRQKERLFKEKLCLLVIVSFICALILKHGRDSLRERRMQQLERQMQATVCDAAASRDQSTVAQGSKAIHPSHSPTTSIQPEQNVTSKLDDLHATPRFAN